MREALHLTHSFSFMPLCDWRKGCRLILAFFWLLGLFCGIFFCRSAGDPLYSLMRSASHCTVSILSLLLGTGLPFLLSAAAVYFSRPVFVLPICFFEAVSFAFISCGVFCAYHTAGWLIRCLLLFSKFVCAPLLYLYWLRYLPGYRKFNIWEPLFLLSLTILIGSFDYRVISPLLVRLIEI